MCSWKRAINTSIAPNFILKKNNNKDVVQTREESTVPEIVRSYGGLASNFCSSIELQIFQLLKL